MKPETFNTSIDIIIEHIKRTPQQLGNGKMRTTITIEELENMKIDSP